MPSETKITRKDVAAVLESLIGDVEGPFEELSKEIMEVYDKCGSMLEAVEHIVDKKSLDPQVIKCMPKVMSILQEEAQKKHLLK